MIMNKEDEVMDRFTFQQAVDIIEVASLLKIKGDVIDLKHLLDEIDKIKVKYKMRTSMDKINETIK